MRDVLKTGFDNSHESKKVRVGSLTIEKDMNRAVSSDAEKALLNGRIIISQFRGAEADKRAGVAESDSVEKKRELAEIVERSTEY